MKYLATLFLSSCFFSAVAQQRQFDVRSLSLPKELAYYDNQFSGLYIAQDKLFLLSESRLQDKAEAKLYTVALADLDRKLADTAYVLPYQKLPITNLARLRAKMTALGQRYEGLEAMLLTKDAAYFSVETATPSANCYLLKGHLGATAVELDTTFLVPLAKPVATDGSHIYNAGFEAMANVNERVVAFFEYNYFPRQNYAYEVKPSAGRSQRPPRPVPVSPVPFRITDMTATGGNHFTAINYFFKGEGDDAVYRTPATDVATTKLIADNGGFKNYCRLIDLELKSNSFTWKPLWEFPVPYMSYNWEGIAAYKGGYFIINDKYTPARPYRTTLLYLQAQK
ncbi:hypothetical protein FNT36_00925 [Hymenobacter setariae]|uniref:Uncharacterized protein n=1 Tax=Hymenobacter setariae TaxID=2594794 RepID=A0A558C1Y5_9BACT|nr:hypothetical protein [Hymenobacter setariae]TVT42687.1 hypothetical protein FNT36_00925 [Hymenobacter setariae]